MYVDYNGLRWLSERARPRARGVMPDTALRHAVPPRASARRRVEPPPCFKLFPSAHRLFAAPEAILLACQCCAHPWPMNAAACGGDRACVIEVAS